MGGSGEISVCCSQIYLLSPLTLMGALWLNPQALQRTYTLSNLQKNWKDGEVRPNEHEKKIIKVKKKSAEIKRELELQ